MDWRQIAKGLKRVIVAAASPRRAVQEIEVRANPSNRPAVSGGEGDDEAPMRPYIPDNDRERSQFSLHTSC